MAQFPEQHPEDIGRVIFAHCGSFSFAGICEPGCGDTLPLFAVYTHIDRDLVCRLAKGLAIIFSAASDAGPGDPFLHSRLFFAFRVATGILDNRYAFYHKLGRRPDLRVSTEDVQIAIDTLETELFATKLTGVLLRYAGAIDELRAGDTRDLAYHIPEPLPDHLRNFDF